MDLIEKIYPRIEELCEIKKDYVCPECGAPFNKETNLSLHLAKTHKQPHLLKSSSKNKIYFCPLTSCKYHTLHHFKAMKLLKQHYLKVHSEKKFACSICGKGFPTEAACKNHEDFCNATFKCCECNSFYECYETLKTHSRRKKHKILEKSAYKVSPAAAAPKSNDKSESVDCSKKLRVLLSKPSDKAKRATIVVTSEQNCQTETSSQQSQETQTTPIGRMPQSNEGTQTVGDYFTKRSSSSSMTSIKTQTSLVEPKTASSNTYFEMADFEFSMLPDVQRNSSSTQTNFQAEPEQIYSSTSTHDSIHTDTSDLLTDTFDSNFFNCNIETQTDFIFNDELFNCDEYANIYTRTCEDLLLGGIGLNNSYTQTVFDDVLKSIESQTVMSQFPIASLSCKDNLANMETQTDTHYQQMLEEINA